MLFLIALGSKIDTFIEPGCWTCIYICIANKNN